MTCPNPTVNLLFPKTTIHPVSHIGDKPCDRGHGVRLFERPIDDHHHPVIILRKPVIARLELIDSHVLRPHDHRAAGVFRVIGADDTALHLKFPVELGPRIGDEDVDGDAVDPDLFHRLDGPVEHVRRIGVEPEDDSPVHQDAAIVNPKPELKEITGAFVVRFTRRPAGEGKGGGISGGANSGISGGTDGGIAEGIDRLADYIRNTPGKNVTEITATLDIPQRTIERWLNSSSTVAKK